MKRLFSSELFFGLNLFLFTSLFAATLMADELYGIKDLEVLWKEKNFPEFFLHARDVRPSLRDQHWKEMVEQMGTEFLLKNIREKNYSLKNFEDTEALMEWPPLKGNEFFLSKREEWGK